MSMIYFWQTIDGNVPLSQVASRKVSRWHYVTFSETLTLALPQKGRGEFSLSVNPGNILDFDEPSNSTPLSPLLIDRWGFVK